jgi:hypothetical protein
MARAKRTAVGDARHSRAVQFQNGNHEHDSSNTADTTNNNTTAGVSMMDVDVDLNVESFVSQDTSTAHSSQLNHSSLSSRLESALMHLQPIRDLSLNWDVDIAACLEDVLNELAAEAQMANEHGFLFEQSQTQDMEHTQHDHSAADTSTMSQMTQSAKNEQVAAHFSQAALLLQNAGFVYGRKVEYLYNLVYQAMKDLGSQQAQAAHKQQTGQSSTTKSGRKSSRATATQSLEDFDTFDSDCNFLLMDNMVPVAPRKHNHGSTYRPNIDLDVVAEEGGDVNNESGFAAARRQLDLSIGNTTNNEPHATANHLSFSVSRVDQDQTNMTARTTPFGKTQGGELSECSQLEAGHSHNFQSKNSALRLEHMMRDLLLKGGNKGSLRLVQGGCDVADNGALVMPGANMIEYENGETPSSLNMNIGTTGTTTADNNSNTSNQPPSSPLKDEPMQNAQATASSPMAHFDDGMDDDDDDDGPGFNFGGGGGDDSPMRDGFQQAEDGADGEPAKPMDVESQPLALPEPQRENDPWAVLETHDAGPSKPRPLKKGNTLRLPVAYGLWEKPSLKVTGARTREDSELAKLKKKTSSKEQKAQQAAKQARKERLYQLQQARNFQAFEGCISHALSVGMDDDGNVTLQPRLGQYLVSSNTDDKKQRKEEAYLHHLLSHKGLAYGGEFAYIAKATATRLAQERKEARLEAAKEAAARGLVLALEPEEEEELKGVYNDGYDDDGDDDGGVGFDFGGGGDNASFGGGGGDQDEEIGDNDEFDAALSNMALHKQDVDKHEQDGGTFTGHGED